MAITSNEIIDRINKNYPKADFPEFKNISDINFEGKIKNAYQYIIGITRADYSPGPVSIEGYQRNMESSLANASLQCKCFGWPFREYELDEARAVLEGLSVFYGAKLDINRMIGRLKINGSQDEQYYYIVVTVVIIPILSDEVN